MTVDGGIKVFLLRGHHLFCLLGYRGMGYSDQYVKEMTRLHTVLREDPQTLITIVHGPDDLCSNFPENEPYHCDESAVLDRDERIVQYLGLTIGNTYTWSDIEQRIIERVVREDIPRFCSTCPWLPYGVCEEGVDRMRHGDGLTPVNGA